MSIFVQRKASSSFNRAPSGGARRGKLPGFLEHREFCPDRAVQAPLQVGDTTITITTIITIITTTIIITIISSITIIIISDRAGKHRQRETLVTVMLGPALSSLALSTPGICHLVIIISIQIQVVLPMMFISIFSLSSPSFPPGSKIHPTGHLSH